MHKQDNNFFSQMTQIKKEPNNCKNNDKDIWLYMWYRCQCTYVKSYVSDINMEEEYVYI